MGSFLGPGKKMDELEPRTVMTELREPEVSSHDSHAAFYTDLRSAEELQDSERSVY